MNPSYNNLKSQFIISCNQNLSNLDIKKLKLYFNEEINSSRMLSKIKTVNKLIVILEKRDLLNEANVQVLKEIALLLNNSNYVEIISEYEKEYIRRKANVSDITTIPNSFYNIQSKNNEEPIFNINSSHSQPHSNDVLNTNRLSKENVYQSVIKNSYSNAILSGLSWTLHLLLIKSFSLSFKLFAIPLGIDSEERKVDKCFELISQEIGHSWKDMTRNLGIREGEIDRIEDKYPRDLRSRCNEVFDIIKKKNPRKLRTDLETALRKSRRNDLANQIAEIFDDC